MGQALQHSGLLNGTYQDFNDNFDLSYSTMNRATASANRWLAEEHHPLTAGPAVINKQQLIHHLVAMANLLKGYARAVGRPYSRYDLRDWRLIVNTIYGIILRQNGRTIDALVIPTRFREEVQVRLFRAGIRVGRFFDGANADAESSSGNLDVLLQYIASKAAEEFARVEGQKAAVRVEKRVVGKVGLMVRNYFFS